MVTRAILGIDAGGTLTRAVCARLDGVRIGGAELPTTSAVATILATAEAALTGPNEVIVEQVIVGATGWARLQEADAAATLARGWASLGLRCPVEILGDVVVAFAAGTPDPDGHVLISGTGAVAAELADRTVTRTADGLGWLLGDKGSAFWIGRAAARDTVAAYERQRPQTSLTRLVVGALRPDGATDAGSVVEAIYRSAPVDLAALAPLVCAAADRGDLHGVEIVEEAATRLVQTLTAVRDPDAASTIVLGGGCLLGSQRLEDAVRQRVGGRWPAATIRTAADCAGGAVWLAARRVINDPPHTTFVGPRSSQL